MIKGFFNETAPLSEYELNVLLPVMVRSLRVKQGKAMAVTSTYIVETLRGKGYEITPARVRKLVNHIRVNNLVPRLIATSSGYYVATTREEMIDFIDSLIGREEAIRAVRVAMERQV